MLIEKYNDLYGEKITYEFKSVPKDLLPWLENIVYENNAKVEKKEWKSKYNSYVIYDYEPFCSDGFDINILISSYDVSYIEFIKYLYKNKLSLINYLDECITM